MSIRRNIISLATVLALVLASVLAASAAQASTFGFEAVEGSFDTANYTVTVDSIGNGTSVAFTFANLSQDASAMTSLYWDFGSATASFSAPTSWVESSGVDYTSKTGTLLPASPANLPGGAGVSFYADFGMNPDAKGGSIHNGIGAGETLTVTFDLLGGTDYNWLVSAMNDGDIRLGVHIQGLGADGALSATGVTTSATPIPGAVWLLGSGLFGLVGLRRVRLAQSA